MMVVVVMMMALSDVHIAFTAPLSTRPQLSRWSRLMRGGGGDASLWIDDAPHFMIVFATPAAAAAGGDGADDDTLSDSAAASGGSDHHRGGGSSSSSSSSSSAAFHAHIGELTLLAPCFFTRAAPS